MSALEPCPECGTDPGTEEDLRTRIRELEKAIRVHRETLHPRGQEPGLADEELYSHV